MFANLTYEDKEAFFNLLDEYFASRPHLFGGAASSSAAQVAYSAASSSPPPVPSPSSRTLPPRAPVNSPPLSPPPVSPSAAAGQKPDMATRLVTSGIKYGGSGLGKLASNSHVNDALGRVGAAAITKGVSDRFGSGATSSSREDVSAKSPPPPPPGKKGGGVTGLTQSKSFGHVDTSSKMSAFTTMFRDPQKVQPASANTYQQPALQKQRSNLPPPSRRAAEPEPEAEAEDMGAEGQAQALYDYEGGDSGDLPVQTGQIVNVIAKTSADWWTCEDGNGQQGLVPANYLKEL